MKLAVGKSILSLNDEQSLRNRKRFDELGLLAVNILASPGAGKTSCIIRLLEGIAKAGFAASVIEGDVASSLDTDRLRAMGYAAIQINTDGGCHLDARMIATAVEKLGAKGPGYLFIENIGNLICPTSFHLGEALRLVIASVAEGDDKPVKYPGVFATADAVILNKIDLLRHVDFRMDFFVAGLRAANPSAPLFNVSCRTGEGVEAALEWLLHSASPDALK
jgi:hydrogenase nickel incorporation protein HypB